MVHQDWGRRVRCQKLVKTLPSEGFLLAPAIHPLKETFDRQVVEVPYPLLVEGDPVVLVVAAQLRAEPTP